MLTSSSRRTVVCIDAEYDGSTGVCVFDCEPSLPCCRFYGPPRITPQSLSVKPLPCVRHRGPTGEHTDPTSRPRLARRGAEALTDPSMGLLMGRKDAQRFRNVVLGLKKGVYIRPSGAPLTIGAPPAT